MRLADLEQYDPITVQCHDNPDGDALAAGFGLYLYFKSKGKNVRMVYAGRDRIQKTNLKLMIDKLEIPVEHIDIPSAVLPGLLITVDCQYGAGNVTQLPAAAVAVIDHHQVDHETGGQADDMSEIRPGLGSCSTLVWSMLLEEKFSLANNMQLSTALYYGLFTDTSQFSEIYNPLDKDMRDSLGFSKGLFTLLRNSNISLDELEIAGIAMLRYIHNSDYKYAVIHAKPCDSNILGLISDFLLQVDEISTCIVYNERADGYKLSVRSCVKEVMANELAAFLCKDIGMGGGHYEKAGGFISKKRYERHYPALHTEAYLSQKMNQYFESSRIIEAGHYELDIQDMDCYIEKRLRMGYIRLQDIFAYGTLLTIRTGEGDMDLVISRDLYIIINVKGETKICSKEEFQRKYMPAEGKYCTQECILKSSYIPTIKNKITGESCKITEYAKVCIPAAAGCIRMKRLESAVKVFPLDGGEQYQLGRPGDYLAVRADNRQDIFVVEQELFEKMYEPGGKLLQR